MYSIYCRIQLLLTFFFFGEGGGTSHMMICIYDIYDLPQLPQGIRRLTEPSLHFASVSPLVAQLESMSVFECIQCLLLLSVLIKCLIAN